MFNIKNKFLLSLWLGCLVLLPILLWVLPANFFDNGQLVLCFSKYFFGLECLGCGMTRAVMHFHHLDFKTALAFNKLVLLFYPFLVFLWYKWIIGTFKKLSN